MKVDSVQLMSVKKGGSFDKLIEMVPEIVSKFGCGKKEVKQDENPEELNFCSVINGKVAASWYGRIGSDPKRQ